METVKKLLILLLLFLFSRGDTQSASEDALCRVQAIAVPTPGLGRLRTIVVRLRDCAPGGGATIRLSGYGGPGSRAVGGPTVLSADRPQVVFVAQPGWRGVLWQAASGRLYPVEVRRDSWEE